MLIRRDGASQKDRGASERGGVSSPVYILKLPFDKEP